MKRLIITSAALMCAALLYGAVDFMISKNHGDLSGLYNENPKQEEQDAIRSESASSPAESKFIFVNEPRTITVATKEETQKAKDKKTAKREIKLEEFSRAALDDIAAEEEIKNDSVKSAVAAYEPAAIKPAIPILVHVMDSLAPAPVKVNAVKQKRKISLGKFSRAPLRAENDSKIVALNDSIK